MDDLDPLARQFETERPRLTAIAHRILGSRAEAEDAVQESWLRLARTDASTIENLPGWLTTVVSRVSLNHLSARRARPEDAFAPTLDPDSATVDADTFEDPEQQALLADAVGLALTIVLDRLTPGERMSFVLHDIFGVSFTEIARILDRSEPATRQLASRARVRLRNTDPTDARLAQARLVDAFLQATRKGDFEALLEVLDPDVTLRPDEEAIALGAPMVTGAHDVAQFLRQAHAARPVFVDGAAGAVWMWGTTPKVVFDFTVLGDRITEVHLVGDPTRVRELRLEHVPINNR